MIKILWGGSNVIKAPTIDQTDKFILKKSKRKKRQDKRAPKKSWQGRVLHPLDPTVVTGEGLVQSSQASLEKLGLLSLMHPEPFLGQQPGQSPLAL